MPSAKIIILKTIVINPKFFKICFIVTITTQDTEFMRTDFFVILCSKFHQLLHLGISTYRRPTCQSITQSRNMAQSLAVATVHIVTNIREYGRKSQIYNKANGFSYSNLLTFSFHVPSSFLTGSVGFLRVA